MKHILTLFGIKIYADTENKKILELINNFLQKKLRPELKTEKELDEEVKKALS